MESTVEESLKTSPMESLPTEILQKILRDLPVHERIRVERVCKKWKNAATERIWRDVQTLYLIAPDSKEKYHSFRDALKEFGKFITTKDNILYIGDDELKIIRSLVIRGGQHVKTLIFRRNASQDKKPMLSIIAAHCLNIESIIFCEVRDSEVEIFSRLIEGNRKLHSISGVNVDNIVEFLPLRHWKKLRFELAVADAEKWDTKIVAFIENSPSLEEFYVRRWSPKIITAILECKQLKNLYFPLWLQGAAYDRIRDISLLNCLTWMRVDSESGDDDKLINLLRHCINLKSLCLLHCPPHHLPREVERTVLTLPKLGSLEVMGTSITNRILSRLRKFKCLTIRNHSESITENGIFRMIMSSKCLERLEICRIDVTMKFFEKLVEKAGERRTILEIQVSTEVYEDAFDICKGSKIHIIEEEP